MSDYIPINCSFHDRLLAWATRRTPCRIEFQNEEKNKQTINGVIVDVFSKDRAEFLKMESGLEIRLDRLVSVNSMPLKTK